MDISSTHNHHHHHHHHTTVKPTRKMTKILSIFLKFIIMSLILSLFLLFIGLAAIILVHLLLAGSFLHRRRRHLLTRSTSPRASSLTLHDIQTHIPPFKYSIQSTADDCSICLDKFNEGEICRVLPVCDHVFHARCVDRWLMKVPSCPVCRTRIRFDSGGSLDSDVSDDDETKFLWAIGVGR